MDDLEAYEDVPIREFLVGHTTKGVYENFFEPLLDAKFGDRKDEVSAAWLLGRIKFRGELDGTPDVVHFAETLEKVCVETVENGQMTKDLALLIGENQKWLTTAEFFDALDANLKRALGQAAA